MTAPFLLIPFLFTFVITVSTEHILIPLLKKTAKQPIYESGPKWHMSKQGTPTMGGIAFSLAVVVVSAVFVTSLFIKEKSTSGLTIALCLAFALLNCLVGVIDDIAKLRKKENKGLSAVQKLIFQFAISITFILFFIFTFNYVFCYNALYKLYLYHNNNRFYVFLDIYFYSLHLILLLAPH